MHQTRKGNEWCFEMKYHIGVDVGTGYVHAVTTTPANAHDISYTIFRYPFFDVVFFQDRRWDWLR